MGSRDYRHREPRKHKKDAKKISPVSIVSPPVTVDVVKKGKKRREGVEEGEEEE